MSVNVERVTVSFYFPGVSSYAHPETRVYTGEKFSVWVDEQTGGPRNEKWIKWSRQSTVVFRA